MSNTPLAPRPPTAPLLDVLAARWWLLAAFATTGAVAALIWSATRPSFYEAATTIIVTPIDATPSARATAVTNARTLLENRSIAATVIQLNGLDRPPESLSAEALVQQRLTVAQIRDTDYMRVTLRLQSPALAAQALAQLVEAGVKLNSDLIVQETRSVAGTLIKQQLDDARVALAAASDRLLVYRRSALVDQRTADADISLLHRSIARKLAAQIAAERARVARAEEQLARRSRTLPAPRRAEGEGALLEHVRREAEAASARSATPDADESDEDDTPVPPTMPDRLIDPVFEVLDYQAATARTKLAALEGQRAAILADTRLEWDRLYTAQAELTRLELEHDLARGTFSRLTQQYETTRAFAITRGLNIQMADAPVPPTGRASPSHLLNATVGGVVGLLCGLTTAFFAWRRTIGLKSLETS